jgi:hypothetical protein
MEASVSNFLSGLVHASGLPIMSSVDEDTNNTRSTSDEIVLIFSPPIQPFSITVRRKTAAGNVFQHLTQHEYIPQTIKVTLDELSCPISLPGGLVTAIKFITENFGNESVVLDIVVIDDLMYLTSFVPVQVTLPGNSSVSINSTLSPPLSCTGSIVSVKATATTVGETLGNSGTVDLDNVCEEEETTQPTKAPTVVSQTTDPVKFFTSK